jgi:hypothetical protein
MSFLRNLLLGLGVLCASAVSGLAQTQDGDATSTFVKAGTIRSGPLDHFNTCIVVSNPTNRDAQYEFGSMTEWLDPLKGFAQHPNPGVTHTQCTCNNPNGSPPLTEGQTVSVIVPTGSIPCPEGDNGSELTSNTVVEKCVAEALVPISSTRPIPASSSASRMLRVVCMARPVSRSRRSDESRPEHLTSRKAENRRDIDLRYPLWSENDGIN